MRPGEVDEEQKTLPPHRGLGELEFADLPSPLSDESLAVSNGPSNNIFAIGKPRENRKPHTLANTPIYVLGINLEWL